MGIGTTFSKLSEDIKRTANIGPKAFCTGTILPCEASNRCAHYGAHNCSTFKKHTKSPCPHYPEHDFRCIRLEGESLEKDL